MKHSLITLLIVVASMNLIACGEAPAKAAAKTTAKPAMTKPEVVSKNLAVDGEKNIDPAALEILERLEKAGEKYTTLQSDVVMTVRSPLTGDVSQRTGRVAYQKGGEKEPSKFRISFETLQQDGTPRMKEKIDYIFDGRYLTEDNYRLKTRTRYQLGRQGEKIEPLKIGEGPFPMPFGQKTADILQYLMPVTRKPIETDPKNTDYLKLLPKSDDGRVNFVRLEMWVDKTTNLPVRIVSKNKNKDVRTVTFANTKTSAKIDPKLFKVKKPFGFKLHIERLK